MILDSGGNVGIGTLEPGNLLEVVGDISCNELYVGNTTKTNFKVKSTGDISGNDASFNDVQVLGKILKEVQGSVGYNNTVTFEGRIVTNHITVGNGNNEINSSTALWLQYDNNRPVKLCNGGGSVLIGTPYTGLSSLANPSHKLTVVGDVSCNQLFVGGTEITSSGGGGTTYDSTTDIDVSGAIVHKNLIIGGSMMEQ